jgi:hypothetical protein
LCKKKKEIEELLITSYFYLLTRGAQNSLHVHGCTTQICMKRNSQVSEDSGCMLYFQYKLLNLMPQFLSNIDCTGTDLGVNIFSQKKSRGFKSSGYASPKTEGSHLQPIQHAR